MKIFKRKQTENKSLYTPKEEALVAKLLKMEWSNKVSNILFLLQQRQVKRKIRIIENKPNKNDIKNGYTRKEFPWLAQFNY